MSGLQQTFLCAFLLLEFILGQRSISNEECQLGFRCLPLNKCQQSDISSVQGQPQVCGQITIWRTQICCSESAGRFEEVPRNPVSPHVNPSSPAANASGNPDRGSISNEECPSGFSCLPLNKCRPSALSSVQGQPQVCGDIDIWRTQICCPQSTGRVNPVRVEERPRSPVRPHVTPPRLPSPATNAPVDPDGGSISDYECPLGFSCTPLNKCRPSALSSIPGQPQVCGDINIWRTQICCPESTRRVIPVPPAEEVATTPSLVANAAVSSSGECGISSVRPARSGVTTGEEDAEQGAWPWMVAITKSNPMGVQDPWCTGFLIDRRHVLSAAHCFDIRERSLYSTRIGHVDLNQGQEYRIRRIAVHPGYANGSYYDDIALITLSIEVSQSNSSPICLPWSRDFMNITGKGTTVTGWGATRLGGQMSTTLKQLNGLPVISNYRCNQAFKERLSSFKNKFPSEITPGLLCAGFMEEGGKDSCGGDSGGPLMFKNSGQWYAVGIVSFGYSCGRRGLPGGYTRVSKYLRWINRNRNDK